MTREGLRGRLPSLLEGLVDELERRSLPVLSLLSIVYFSVSALLASIRPLWVDERFTIYLSSIQSVGGLWRALLTGVDQHPPPFYLISRAFLVGFSSDLAVRVPAILGFWLMCLCVFVLVSRRTCNVYGYAAMLLPLVTAAYDLAYDGRGYGLALGLSALALLCWQAAAQGRRRPLAVAGLSASLMAAVSTHYYALLVVLPLALGEIGRWASGRRVDIPVWLALASPSVPLLLFLPLIRASMGWSPHFWARPSWSGAFETYNELLEPAVVPLTVLLVVTALWMARERRGGVRPDEKPAPSFPAHEILACVGLAALPFVAVVVGMTVTNAYQLRYVLAPVIGIACLFASVTFRLARGWRPFGALISLLFLGWFGVSGVRSSRILGYEREDLDKALSFLQANTAQELPIVTADALPLYQLEYYAPKELAERFVYLADPEAEIRHFGHDTLDRSLLALRPWSELPVTEYAGWVSRHSRFYVYTDVLSWSWLTYRLLEEGYQMRLVARDGYRRLYVVERIAAGSE